MADVDRVKCLNHALRIYQPKQTLKIGCIESVVMDLSGGSETFRVRGTYTYMLYGSRGICGYKAFSLLRLPLLEVFGGCCIRQASLTLYIISINTHSLPRTLFSPFPSILHSDVRFPDMSTVAISVDNTLGALLVGFSVSCCLFGIVLSQVFSYFSRFHADKLIYKILVSK